MATKCKLMMNVRTFAHTQPNTANHIHIHCIPTMFILKPLTVKWPFQHSGKCIQLYYIVASYELKVYNMCWHCWP